MATSVADRPELGLDHLFLGALRECFDGDQCIEQLLQV
jgi:hypothetical protein